MRVGASLWMSWLEDLAGCRDAVVALDEAGFDHVEIGGHLVSTEEGRYPEMPPVAYAATFRDPFVFFASLAPVTARIRLRTSILILPMLPTVLVAKQAADLAILSNGRFDLGVGISWQDAEYRAMGQSLKDRGRRLEEQVEVLRRLWTEPFVSFSGEFHEIDAIGLGQLPPTIPIWFGCGAGELPLRRAGRLADGWLPIPGPTEESAARLRAYAQEAGRDPGAIGIGALITAGDDVVAEAEAKVAAGATELTLSTAPELGLSHGVEAILAAGEALKALRL